MQNKTNSQPLTGEQWIKVIPIILLLGLCPIFLKYVPINYPAIPVDWKFDNFITADLFTYAKSIILLVVGIMSILYIAISGSYKFLFEKRQRFLLTSLISFLLCLILSTVFSKFYYTALWGYLEKFEGIFAWISYLLFTLYIAVVSKDIKILKFIQYTILSSGLLITFIGFSQFMSIDLFKMDWMISFLLPQKVADTARFAFEANRVYTTLYNPNFVAMYVATMLPFSLGIVFTSENVKERILWILYSLLLLVNLIGAKSDGGYAGLIISFVAILGGLILKKVSLSNKVKQNTFLALYLCFIVSVVIFSSGLFNSKMPIAQFSPKYALSNVTMNGFDVKFTYNNKILVMKANDKTYDSISFYTDDNVYLNIGSTAEGSNYIVNPDFKNILFTTGLTENKLAYITLKIDNVDWSFVILPTGLKYVNGVNTPVQIQPSNGAGGFVGHEQFGTARGFIWSRTLLLIQQSPIVGYGADNFVIAFPQNDHSMKYQVLDLPQIIVDKAHNFYLQIAMNFGIPGAIALLALIGYSLYSLFGLYLLNSNTTSIYYLAVIGAIFGYLGSSIFYDSNLHVSPFFWTFIGLGLVGTFRNNVN